MTNGETPIYGLREPICTLTHFAALLWAIYAALILWRMCRGEPLKQRCVGCFGLSMVLLFAASSLYHAVIAPPHVIAVLRRIDMSMVYILIAGTFTPVMSILPAGRQRTAMAVVLWGLAGLGIAVRWFLPGDGFELNVALYLLMGWLGLWPLAVVSRLSARAVSLAVVGGLFYTAGAVCDVVRWPRHPPRLHRMPPNPARPRLHGRGLPLRVRGDVHRALSAVRRDGGGGGGRVGGGGVGVYRCRA